MTAIEHETHETTHVGIGLLQQVADDLADLVAYLRDDRLSFDVDAIYTPFWNANGFADVELGELYRGVAIFNLSGVNDVQVGFAAGTGTPAARAFTVSARGYLTLPILTSHVSVGSIGGGPAVIIGLKHAPPIGGGRF